MSSINLRHFQLNDACGILTSSSTYIRHAQPLTASCLPAIYSQLSYFCMYSHTYISSVNLRARATKPHPPTPSPAQFYRSKTLTANTFHHVLPENKPLIVTSGRAGGKAGGGGEGLCTDHDILTSGSSNSSCSDHLVRARWRPSTHAVLYRHRRHPRFHHTEAY